MSEKRFTWKTEKLEHLDDEVIIVVDNANKEWKGHILNIVDLLNELSDDNRQLKKLLKGNNEKFGKCWDRIYSLEKENEQLKERLERINGGYGHLTHRNGLTANEWLIESQERELKKKNEQISTLKEEREQLQKKNKGLGDDLYNCRANKNIISKVLKLWQNTLAEYDIYTIKDFTESFELDAKINKEKDEKIKELEVKVLNLELELMKYE